MSGGVVPKDDLPANIVPADDMPGDAPQSGGPSLAGFASRMWPAMIPGGAAMKMASDLPGVAYQAGGAVTDQVAKVAPPPVAAAAGMATDVGLQAVPTLLGGGIGSKAAPAAISKAKGLMQSALKPSKEALKSGKAGKAVDTMLERGVNVTEGGVEQLTKYIDDLDDQLERVIGQSKAQVSKMEVLKPIKEALARFREKANPNADLAEIRAAAKEFFNHPALRGKETMPIQQAQAMKRATYRGLGDKAYGAGLKSDAERDAQKALAEGLRKGVENPGQHALDAEYLGIKGGEKIGAINAEMGPLINARDLAQGRVLMSGNKNPFGLGIIGNLKHLPMWLADRSELAKSVGANALYSAGQQPEILTGAGAGLGGATGAVLGLPLTPPQRNSR